MKRTGMAVVALGAILQLQGCIFAPYDEEQNTDPFFFSPEEHKQGGEFVEVGNYMPSNSFSATPSRPCAIESSDSKVGSPCWFFPVMRVY